MVDFLVDQRVQETLRLSPTVEVKAYRISKEDIGRVLNKQCRARGLSPEGWRLSHVYKLVHTNGQYSCGVCRALDPNQPIATSGSYFLMHPVAYRPIPFNGSPDMGRVYEIDFQIPEGVSSQNIMDAMYQDRHLFDKFFEALKAVPGLESLTPPYYRTSAYTWLWASLLKLLGCSYFCKNLAQEGIYFIQLPGQEEFLLRNFDEYLSFQFGDEKEFFCTFKDCILVVQVRSRRIISLV